MSTRQTWSIVWHLIFVGCLVAAATPVAAQMAAAMEDKPINDQIRAEIVDSAAHALKTVYIEPDVAAKIERLLRDNLKKKAYAGLDGTRAFTERLTEDLRSVNHDRHLWVEYLTDEAIALLNSDTTGAAADAEHVRQSRRVNFGFRELKILPGNVGYLKLNGFSDFNEAGTVAVAAMNFLSNADAIIIDLRDNGGGSTKMIQLLTSYLFDEPVHLNDFYIRRTDSTQQFWTQAHVSGPRLTGKDVYILTSHFTFSAAEEFSYNLKNLKRATLVGDTTGGGAHPNDFLHWRNLHVTMSIPFGKAINPITHTNWEGTGVAPDIAVPSAKALEVAQREALKKLRARATDESDRAMLDWSITGLDDKINPATVDVTALSGYAGTYGQRVIKLENGKLFYRRGENPWAALIPMSESLFRLENVDYFRLEVIRDGQDKPTALAGHYDNGMVDRSERTGP